MIELKKFINSLEKTIKDSDLHNVTIGLSETLIDSLIDDGICKDIPIIGSILGVGKVALGVRERFFFKKRGVLNGLSFTNCLHILQKRIFELEEGRRW